MLALLQEVGFSSYQVWFPSPTAGGNPLNTETVWVRIPRELLMSRTPQQAHYDRNPEYYLEKNKRARERKSEYLRELRDNPCTDCGQNYPWYVMEFDHLRDKHLPLSRMVSASWKQIYAELEKCELVCANCHAVRTHNRRHA